MHGDDGKGGCGDVLSPFNDVQVFHGKTGGAGTLPGPCQQWSHGLDWTSHDGRWGHGQSSMVCQHPWPVQPLSSV